MRLFATTFLLALAFATAPAARPVAAVTIDADARCLVAMEVLLTSTSPSDQAYGQAGTLYFTGRIAARDPGFDFGRLGALAAATDAKAARDDRDQTCGPMFQKSMTQLSDALVGSALASSR